MDGITWKQLQVFLKGNQTDASVEIRTELLWDGPKCSKLDTFEKMHGSDRKQTWESVNGRRCSENRRKCPIMDANVPQWAYVQMSGIWGDCPKTCLSLQKQRKTKWAIKTRKEKECLSMEILKMVLTVELEKIRSRMFFRVLNVLGKNQIFSHCRC